jgi:hypothetical protein
MAHSGEPLTSQPRKLPQAGTLTASLNLDGFLKALPFLAFLSYGIGVLAITTYLHELGIADFSLTKPKLVLTGILVLLTFLVLAVSPLALAWRLAFVRAPEAPNAPGAPEAPEARTSPATGQMILWMLLPPLLLASASASLCFAKTTGLGQITVWWIWEKISTRSVRTETLASLILTLEVFLPVCIAVFSAVHAKRLLKRIATANAAHLLTHQIHLAVATAVALSAFIAYIDIFSLTFYPAIPLPFGGGKPYFESFALASREQCQLQRLGIPLADEQQGVTMALPILHESDTLLAAWLQGISPKDKPQQDKSQQDKSQPNQPPQANSSTQSQPALPDGFGRARFVVVQIDKSQIIAARAHPRLTEAPMLALRSLPCGPSNANPSPPLKP